MTGRLEYSDILSDIYSVILNLIIYCGILSGIYSVILSDKYSGFLSDNI